MSGEPSTFTVIHSGIVSTRASAAKAQAASHLPTTICHGWTGSVIRSSMVPLRRSSAHSRIAIAGISTR